MRPIFAFLMLSSLALGQTIPTTPVLATTAPVTLWLAADGTDGNTCLFPYQPCKTLTRALSKLPTLINHDTVVNVAAGTLLTTFDMQTPLIIARGVTLSIVGRTSAFSPTTGAASGTTTASAAGGNAGPGTFTDSGQSWTTDNLRGAFVLFTSGTLSGTAYPIYKNTATVVTIPSVTAAGTGATYSIIQPASIFSTTGTTPGRIANILGAGALSISNIAITRSAGTGVVLSTVGPSVAITLTNVSLTGSATNSFSYSSGGGTITFNRSFIQATGSSAAFSCQGSTITGPIACSVGSSVVRATGNSATVFAQSGTGAISASVAEGANSAGGQVLYGGASAPASASSLWIFCTTGTSTGLVVGSAATGAISQSSVFLPSNGALRITGCTNGLVVNGGSKFAGLQLNFDTVTTAIAVNKGGEVDLLASAPSFTTVTNELSLDSVNTTYAALSAAGPPALLSNTYKSIIIK